MLTCGSEKKILLLLIKFSVTRSKKISTCKSLWICATSTFLPYLTSYCNTHLLHAHFLCNTVCRISPHGLTTFSATHVCASSTPPSSFTFSRSQCQWHHAHVAPLPYLQREGGSRRGKETGVDRGENQADGSRGSINSLPSWRLLWEGGRGVGIRVRKGKFSSKTAQFTLKSFNTT